MSGSQSEELGRKLRANRGRRQRPSVQASIERATGTRVTDADFLDLGTTHTVAIAIGKRLRAERPHRTWPESSEADAFRYLMQLANGLDPEHSSYLALFEGSDDTGAVEVSSSVTLANFESVWEIGREPFCLTTVDLRDCLYFDHTDSDQVQNEDEFELWAWGAFAKPST